MKIVNLYKGNFQRNGISGESFYSVFCDYSEGKELHKNFLITFQVKFSEDDKPYKDFVDWTTCRVVKIDKPLLSWRGDNFADALNAYFKNNGINDVYEYFKTTLK